jgi:hypothetical protein
MSLLDIGEACANGRKVHEPKRMAVLEVCLRLRILIYHPFTSIGWVLYPHKTARHEIKHFFGGRSEPIQIGVCWLSPWLNVASCPQPVS